MGEDVAAGSELGGLVVVLEGLVVVPLGGRAEEGDVT